MDLGAPVRSEAVCDFAEHDRGTDLALGYVVGRRDVAVGEEDEELAPPCLDLFEQNPACGMRDGHPYEAGQHGVGLGTVGRQGRILQTASSLADADGPTQMVADLRGEGPITAVDGILNVAQDVGEADLVLLAQFLLSRIAVGDPHIGLVSAQNLLGDTARPARGDPVQDGLFREEDPLPVDDTVGAGRGLVGCDDPCGQQLVGDRAGSGSHAGFHAPEGIGDGALGDAQAE